MIIQPRDVCVHLCCAAPICTADASTDSYGSPGKGGGGGEGDIYVRRSVSAKHISPSPFSTPNRQAHPHRRFRRLTVISRCNSPDYHRIE